MNFEELISQLNRAHLYPSKIVNVGKKGEERIVALRINCASIIRQSREDVIKSVIGKELYKVTYFGNDEECFLIEKK